MPIQTRSPPTARVVGRPPVCTVSTTAARVASIRETLFDHLLATQRDRFAKASAAGPLPTAIVATTRGVAGSMRETVPSRLFATQTDPNGPTAYSDRCRTLPHVDSCENR